MIWQLFENEVKENNQLNHPCTRKTSRLIHNTGASDFCQKRLALLYYSFYFVSYIFVCSEFFVVVIQDEE